MGLKGALRVSTVLVVFLAITYQCMCSVLNKYEHGLIASLCYGLLGLVFGMLSIICIDILHLNPADSFTWLELVDHYCWFTFHIVRGSFVFREIEDYSKDITKQQDAALREIIHRNGTTDYYKDHGIDKVLRPEDFRKNVPFGSYDRMKGYIERLKEGDLKAFTNEDVKCVVYTSGTTGTKKYFPMVKSAPIQELKQLKEYTVYRRVGRSMGRTMMLFHTYSGFNKQPGKPEISSMSSAIFSLRTFWLIPYEVFSICLEPSYLYASAIFALRERELDGFKSTFASVMFSFWVVIGNNWQQMCDVIERGYIERGTLEQVDDETLSKINALLTPDPERARDLRREFKMGLFRISRRIWPRIQYVDMVSTGTLAHSADLLRENQLYGVPFLSLHFASSEVMAGFISDTELDRYFYTMFPLKQYYEWIPEDNASDSNPKTLVTSELEVGKSYEMVSTTLAGLTRYRTGDILKVVDKYNQLPIYIYGHRYGQLLSIAGEKVTEKAFYESLLAACRELNVQLTDYTCTESSSMHKNQVYIDNFEDPAISVPKYLVFCEFSQNGRKTTLSEDDKKLFDDILRKEAELYDLFRSTNILGQPNIIEMKQGAFQVLKNAMIQETQTQQFKMPRLIHNPVYLDFLLTLTEKELKSSQKKINGVV